VQLVLLAQQFGWQRSLVLRGSGGCLNPYGLLKFADDRPGQARNARSHLNLHLAVAGLKMAHLPEITSAFEFAVLTLTVPGL
jgi:hypothetical protein